MNPVGFKTTKPRNSTDHRSGLSVSVAEGILIQSGGPQTDSASVESREKRERSSRDKPIRGCGITSDFKPATFRGFRNVAESRSQYQGQSNSIRCGVHPQPTESLFSPKPPPQTAKNPQNPSKTLVSTADHRVLFASHRSVSRAIASRNVSGWAVLQKITSFDFAAKAQ